MKRTRLRRGHTLVEVMMALFMLTVCVVIFASTLPAAFESRAKADNANIATSLANKMLEAMRTVGFDNIDQTRLAQLGLLDNATAVSGTDTFSWTNVDNGVVDSPGTTLTAGVGRLRIETLAVDLIRLTATVQWREDGQTRSIVIATLVSDV